MKKKALISILGLLIGMNIYGCNEKNISNGETAKLDSEKDNNYDSNSNIESIGSQDSGEIIQDVYSVKDINVDKKKEIARNLFDEYINDRRIDSGVAKNKKPVVSFTDYKIGRIDFVSEEGNKFTVDISYDIQYTDESNFWIAGNGEICEDNWIKNKCNFVDISRDGDKYIITDIYTGE